MNEIDQLKQRIEYLEGVIKTLNLSDRFMFTKHLQIMDGRNIQVAIGVGTKIGTAASQKLGFFGKTPKVQVPTASVPSTADGIITTLKEFGFYET